MSSPAIRLSATQEEHLHTADLEVDEAMRELERWLRSGSPGRPAAASMTEDERARYDAARARLRQLNDEREALRVSLFAERSEEIRREHLTAMVMDQEARHAVARAATNHRSSGSSGGLLRRLFGKR